MREDAKGKPILCEVCHERVATHHICNGSTGKSSNLCEECFEKTAPTDIRASMAEAHEARCEYCGSQQCIGETDFLSIGHGLPKLKFMCQPCSTEYHQYLKVHMLADAAGRSQAEQITAMRRLAGEVDDHMNRWVAEKGSR